MIQQAAVWLRPQEQNHVEPPCWLAREPSFHVCDLLIYFFTLLSKLLFLCVAQGLRGTTDLLAQGKMRLLPGKFYNFLLQLLAFQSVFLPPKNASGKNAIFDNV